MGNRKKYYKMYVVSHVGGEIIVTPLRLRGYYAQGKTVYRTETGTTYSARSVKRYSDLTVAERLAYAEQQYQQELRAIEWDIAKYPTLEESREAWEAEAKKRKDNRIAEINKPKLTPEQRAMIEHNLEIIEDNIGYGLKDFLRGVRTEQEVIAYEREAKAELRRFKRHLLNGGKAVYNDESQIWEIPQEEHK